MNVSWCKNVSDVCNGKHCRALEIQLKRRSFLVGDHWTDSAFLSWVGLCRFTLTNLSLPHTLSEVCQGSVCVSSELCPPMQCCGNLTSHLCSYERHVVERKRWLVSQRLMNRSVPFRWPLALFSSLSHLDPCGPVRWVCVRGRKACVPLFLVHLFFRCIVQCCECDCQEKQWMVSQYLINTYSMAPGWTALWQAAAQKSF